MEPYERTKKWRQENKEKHRLQWKKHYEKHHDDILEKKRNKYKLNKMKSEQILSEIPTETID